VRHPSSDGATSNNGQRITAIQSDLPAGFGLGASAYSAVSGSVCAVDLPESLLRLFRDLKTFSEKADRIEGTVPPQWCGVSCER
jgi:homoserine kinase